MTMLARVATAFLQLTLTGLRQSLRVSSALASACQEVPNMRKTSSLRTSFPSSLRTRFLSSLRTSFLRMRWMARSRTMRCVAGRQRLLSAFSNVSWA